jgi:hypothetical protein
VIVGSAPTGSGSIPFLLYSPLQQKNKYVERIKKEMHMSKIMHCDSF